MLGLRMLPLEVRQSEDFETGFGSAQWGRGGAVHPDIPVTLRKMELHAFGMQAEAVQQVVRRCPVSPKTLAAMC